MHYAAQALLLLRGASCCGAVGEDGEAVALQPQLPQQPQPAAVDGAVVMQPQHLRQPQPAAVDGVAVTQLLHQVRLCFPA